MIDLIDYLNKKNIDIYYDEYDDMVWLYKEHYSNFKIKISVFTDYNKDKKFLKYYASESVTGLHKKKTYIHDNNSYRLNVYKQLLIIKKELEKRAIKYKIETESKNKYCLELERYYNRKHKSINISTHEIFNNVQISVSAHDIKKSHYYKIEYKNNKYYLIKKTVTLKQVINMKPLN